MTVIISNGRDIEYLLYREFPGSWELITLSSLHSEKPVSATAGQQRNRDDLQQKIDRRRGELTLLRITAPSEFEGLVSAAREEDARKQEAQQFFNQPHARADFDHWGKLAYWSLDEGIALCFGRDPRTVKWENIAPLVQVSPFAKQFADAREIALRAAGVNEIAQSNIPSPFIAWAKRVRLPFPAELEAKVAERGPIADWHAVYEQEHAAHAATQAQLADTLQKANAAIDALQDQLAKAQDASAHRWPWGTYETELLRKVADAVTRFWVNYDPADPSSANTNDTVKNWLKGQRVSDRVAEVIAQIIRVDGLRTGPR